MARFSRSFTPWRRLQIPPALMLGVTARGTATFTGALTASVTVVTLSGSASFSGALTASIGPTALNDHATLLDTVTGLTVNFYCDADVKLGVKRVGSESYPMGSPYAVTQTDGQKGWDATMVVDSTSPSMDANLKTLCGTLNPIRLTLPDGRTGLISIKSGTNLGSAMFSQWNWAYLNKWTLAFVQIGA